MLAPFRLTCCLCRSPLTQGIYELDAEWQRRFPDIVGTLACHDCALRTDWTCTRNGLYVEGHIPAGIPVPCIDASSPCTHRSRVLASPHSGLLQGAEPYLRSVAARRGTSPVLAYRLRTVLQEWEEEHGIAGARQTTA
ncbi:hypothetical protein ACWEF9_37730 [Streptomyces sp. NPDC004980]